MSRTRCLYSFYTVQHVQQYLPLSWYATEPTLHQPPDVISRQRAETLVAGRRVPIHVMLALPLRLRLHKYRLSLPLLTTAIAVELDSGLDPKIAGIPPNLAGVYCFYIATAGVR